MTVSAANLAIGIGLVRCFIAYGAQGRQLPTGSTYD